MCAVPQSLLKWTGVWYPYEVNPWWNFKDGILVIKMLKIPMMLAIHMCCVHMNTHKSVFFQEWGNWCLGYRSWECDFGVAWKENPRIHLECIHEGIFRCLPLTDGRIIQKNILGRNKKREKDVFISINCALLSNHMHFDLSFPIKLKNQPKKSDHKTP